MSVVFRSFRGWSNCDECGFEGVLTFSCRDDENYDDRDSLGMFVDALCPACDTVGSVLVSVELFDEMQDFEKTRRGAGGEGE